MSHATNSTTPDVNIDIHATLRLMQEQIQLQQDVLQQQQAKIQRLEASNSEQDGKVVFKNQRATTLKLYDELLQKYPAIGQDKFFNSKLPKDHDAFNWDDFHYTEGMQYKPSAVVAHPKRIPLSDQAKRHEADLQTIQGYLAHNTRFYDTFAHEIISSGQANSEIGRRTLAFLNTLRISAAHDASRISDMRKDVYGHALGIKLRKDDEEEPLLTQEDLAAARTEEDLYRKNYKKYEPPKDKSKKPGKSGKDKTGPGDKPKDQQSGKSQSNDKSGYRSDSGKSGYKSDGGKSGGKHRNKSGNGSGKKQPDQGNDGEKSD